MKIAFVSFEFPPDTAYGGIATYVHQAARLLSSRGQHVEVFTSSPHRSGAQTENGVVVHRIHGDDQKSFRHSVGLAFAARQSEVKFDVLEGPEYSADAWDCIRLVPNIPFVIKLHTPSFLVSRFSRDPSKQIRDGGFFTRVLSASKHLWGHDGASTKRDIADDIERAHTLQADEIAAPSRAIGEMLTKEWGLDPTKISDVPYPYVPPKKLLTVPIETHTNTVTFLGRLEIRKGVVDLAKAIPLILRRHPKVKFRFIGPSEESPEPELDMRQFLERKLSCFGNSVEFGGEVPFDAIWEVLARTDICVYPSLWENFPCVCLEAMAAARGIVASSSGGIPEMLDGGSVGRLVPPFSPKKIAKAVIKLLDNPELRMSLGQRARDRVLLMYSAARIAPLQEASYCRAISRRLEAGARTLS